MVTLTVRGEGFEAMEIGFSRLLRLSNDFSGAWPSVTKELRQIMAEQFTSQGATGQSGKWAPLSGRYRAYKARTYPGRTILERTGRLRASLQVQTGDTVIEETAHSLFFGTDVPYGLYHQTGTSRMERRPIFSLTNRQAATIGSAVHKWLGAEMSKAFAGARAA